MDKLAGTIQGVGGITGDLSSAGGLSGDISMPDVMPVDPYEGPYSVTPTESAQTLETDEKLMEDNVSVGAIPSNYVGSGVPRKTSADLTASGPTVTAPAGYYAATASKAVSSGAASTPNTSITVDVDVSLSATGLITATASGSQSVTPDVVEGYVERGTAGTVSVDGLKKVQLPTQAAKTVTPTETEQTAVAAQKYATGDIKVAAIPSDYIGSEVPQKSSSDMTASGATVTAPAGYYEEDASASVPNATWKNASTVGVVPEISVDANGLVTANCAGWTSIHPLTASGYADKDTAANIQLAGVKTSQLDTLGATTYTPAKGSPIIITPGKFLTGDQTISAIPDSWYDMSGDMSWLGADATLVHEIDPVTVALKDTDFNSWTPSTTAATVVASQTLSGSAQKYVATDLLLDGGYNYVNLWNMKMPIDYGTNTPTQKALPLFSCGLLIQTLFRRYSSFANLLDGNLNNNVDAQTTVASFLRYYGSTTGSITYTNSASYGFYYANAAPTISSTTAQSPTITLKTPTMSARCSTTHMSTTNAGLIDKTNTKLTYTCKVYRVRQDAYLQGFYRYLAARVAEMAS